MMAASLNGSFVFYQSFYDMIALIPDMETQLAAYGVICAYALNGIEPQTDNWLLKMVFCSVKPLIDNNRKRRENGKKGGRKPAEEMQTEAVTEERETNLPRILVKEDETQYKKVQEENTPGFLVQKESCQEKTKTALQAIELPTGEQWTAPTVSQITEPQNIETQVTQQVMEQQRSVPQEKPQSAQRREQPEGQATTQQAMASPAAPQTITASTAMQTTAIPIVESEQADLWEGEPILRYGENKYPITQRELNKVQRFAQELFQTYGGGRRPNEADMERVMEYTVARREIDGDRAVAVLDEGRADLLWYAFEKASAAQKLNWRYIDGMYRRFEQRDITTGAEAYQYDLLRGMTVS